jgi:hypothetical protein
MPMPVSVPVPVPVRPPPPELDLVLVIDATGSMSPAIKAVHDHALNLASTFRINRSLQLRIACICYRDPIDSPEDIHEIHEFNPSVRQLQTFLKGIQATGGGDGPEDYVGAINALRSLQWRSTANHAIAWIADANAHGRRYCGHQNHQEEESKLEPLVIEMIKMKVKIQGFSIKGKANRTFSEMEKIYQAINPGLFFKFQDFKPGTGPIEIQAKTMGEVISTTMKTCAHEFIDPPEICDVSPDSRLISPEGCHHENHREVSATKRDVDLVGELPRRSHRSITFVVPH